MKRKINRVGTSTLTVSLPSKWARQQGLKPGDEVEVVEEGASLKLGTEGIISKKERKLDISGYTKRMIRSLLNNLYRNGYDKLEIHFSTLEEYASIQEESSGLMGFEITNRFNNFCIIENVALPDNEKQEVILKRCFLIINESFEILREDMVKGSYNNYPLIDQQFRKVNQYINFCMRSSSNLGGVDNEKTADLLVFNLFMIMTTIRRAYFFLSSHKATIGKETCNFFKTVSKDYYRYFTIFYKQGHKELIELDKDLDKLLNETILKTNSLRKEEVMVMAYSFQVARFIAILISPTITLFCENQISK